MKDKNFYKAIADLYEAYDQAKEQDWIYDPLAYALYHVWKKVDEERVRNEKHLDEDH